jgi:hypothetical protein
VKVVVGVTAALAGAATVVTFVLKFQDRPPTPTAVTVVHPVAAANQKTVADVICSETSAVSVRPDARTCLMAYLLLEPCFDVGADIVECPVLTRREGSWATDATYYRSSLVKAGWDDELAARVTPVDIAARTTPPWAIVVLTDDGERKCVLGSEIGALETGTARYDCVGVPMIVANQLDYWHQTNPSAWAFQPSDGLRPAAYGLDQRDGGVWTILFDRGDGSPVRDVAVQQVWY